MNAASLSFLNLPAPIFSGFVYLVHELRDLLLASAPCQVVVVASDMHNFVSAIRFNVSQLCPFLHFFVCYN